MTRLAVIGATGTIGRPLVEALAGTQDVVGIARTPPATADTQVHWIAADATDAAAITSALDGVDVVYHLVHSLGSADFEARDRLAASAVAASAAEVGATQIVYLGGLGEGGSDLSPHLRSRAETASILRAGTVPVTTLRAAMIVGPGSVAFETILALVERLPVMICPRWVSVETQPIALTDVLAALVGVCGEPRAYGETFDVGGPEVMTYRTMMERAARLRGKRPILIEVPFLTPRLSSLWLHLVTRANVAVARPLVEGLRIPTVAHDDRIWELVGARRTPFDESVRAALRERGA
ncbi:MAG: NAD(P)H-binding protein [Gaiellaceae bacterium]